MDFQPAILRNIHSLASVLNLSSPRLGGWLLPRRRKLAPLRQQRLALGQWRCLRDAFQAAGLPLLVARLRVHSEAAAFYWDSSGSVVNMPTIFRVTTRPKPQPEASND